MRFSRWVVFTFVIHVLVVVIDKGAGLVVFKILEDYPHLKGTADLLSILPFIMMAVANLGLATSLVFFLKRKRFGFTEAGETCSLVALVWGLAVAGLAVVLSQTLGPLIKPDWEWSLAYVVPISLCVPLLLTSSYFNSLQLAADRIRQYNFVHLFGSAVFLPLFLLLYYVVLPGAVAVDIAFSRLLAAMLIAAAVLWMARGIARWRPRMHWDFFKAGVTYGWKANLTSVLTYLNHRIDLFLVGILFVAVAPGTDLKEAQLAQVAFYSMAVSFAELVWHFPEATRDLFFSKVAGSTHEEARVFTPTLTRLCLAASVIGSVAILLAVDPVMNVISPERWDVTWSATVGQCLVILLPGTAGYTVAKILQNDLAARGHIEHCLVACILVLVVMLGLDAVLIPQRGAVGAAWASTVAYLVSSAYSLFAYRLCGGGHLLACLVPRPGDWYYVREILVGIADKLRRRRA